LLCHAVPLFSPGAASRHKAAQSDGRSQKTSTPGRTWEVSKCIGTARSLATWYTSADPANDIKSATASAARILNRTLRCRIVPVRCARISRTWAFESGPLTKVNSRNPRIVRAVSST
jgi:hypothetical protein